VSQLSLLEAAQPEEVSAQKLEVGGLVSAQKLEAALGQDLVQALGNRR
jgi:hypothetical protein